MSDTLHRQPEPRDPLVRGEFSDGHTKFAVRASTSSAPDSFQVSADGNCADLVLIVSGLNSGHLHATWGNGWRTFAPDWKVWVEDAAFKVFYNGHAIDNRTNRDNGREGGLGTVRFCDG
ncbi:hypothetical protein [Glycomyces harbinensis]|uniref:Uncharacterized protein n=1 Tax=Glycomyces harbinensis TaxID=58114 RepID=A0A1G6RI96_9ACTN|nr:hypothetical protein [Glycomyces harbinensis]SDD04113.1 hypothetical protein SAMN05216270_101497 [Glycomyces harbinensis]